MKRGVSFSIVLGSMMTLLALACSGAGVRSPQRDVANTQGTLSTAQAPLPGPSVIPAPDFKEILWSVEKGMKDPIRSLTIWKAERGIDQTTLTRVAGFTAPQGEMRETKLIPLSQADEQKLNSKLARLTTSLPSSPGDKEKCPQWIEIETIHGKRIFCDGREAAEARQFVEMLDELAGVKPQQTDLLQR